MSEFEKLKELIQKNDLDQIAKISKEFKDSSCVRLSSALLDKNTGKGDLSALLHNFIAKGKLCFDPFFEIEWSNCLPPIDKLDPNLFIIRPTQSGHRISIDKDFSFDWISSWDKFKNFYEATLKGTSSQDFYPNLDYNKPQSDYPVKYFTGYDNYNNEAQKTAIRSMFQMNEGDTLLVTLPTGAGKSLLFHLSTLINMEPGSMTLVIVPTISLADDHERSFKDLLGIRYPGQFDNMAFAYSGNLNPDEKKAIKYRIINGEQTILFTSPESILSSLLFSINIANKNGFVKYIFIDEAHIITDWGSNFRPDFQFLVPFISYLKQEMKKSHPFKTVLMTATLTPSCEDALKSLFGENCQTINGSDLRKELVFWKNKCGNITEKDSRLFELLKFLPRPILIYDTRRENVENLVRKLSEKGYKRCCAYHGGTDGNARKEVLDSWHKNELDIIVANSAFGLGVSKGNVRSVIHFCVPESLDRFYQEVGRSGRDGNLAISYMLFSDYDISKAKRLNIPKLITKERAEERWNAMWNQKDPLDDGSFKLHLGDFPLDIYEDSDTNQLWNKRTLILMNRAQMINLEFRMPELDVVGDTEDKVPKFVSDAYVRDVGFHGLPDHWDRFEVQRQMEVNAAIQQFSALKELITGTRHYGEGFGDLYNIRKNYQSCVSCPNCRTTQRLNRNARNQIKPQPIRSNLHINPNEYYFLPTMDYLRSNFGTMRRNFLNTLHYLIRSNDIREIFLTSDLLTFEEIYDYLNTGGIDFLITRDSSESESYIHDIKCNRLSIVSDQLSFNRVINVSRPKHIILFPNDMTIPLNPNILFTQANQNCKDFREFFKELP